MAAPRKTTARVARKPVARKMDKPAGIHPMGERPRWIRIMVYAEPGSGKTPLAGTSPGNVLILNADGPDAPESARVFSNYKGDIWDMTNYKDLDDSYEYLRHTPKAYDWVWFDGVTLFQESGMDEIMKDLVKKKAHRSLYVPDQLQYVENQNHLGVWLRKMRHLPLNLGITAHVMRLEDQDDGTVTYMPAIQGGGKVPMTTKVCGYMSIVGRLYVVTRKKEDKEENIPVLQTARDSKWYAKDRFGALGGKMANPTIPKVVGAIEGSQAPTRRQPRRRTA